VTIKAVACDEFDLASVLGEYSYVISTGKTVVLVDDSDSPAEEEDDSDNPVANLFNRYFDIVSEVVDEEEDDIEEEVIQEEEDIENVDIDNVDEEVVKKGFDWWWIVIAIFVCIFGYVVVRKRSK
jgi:hypothetical protein